MSGNGEGHVMVSGNDEITGLGTTIEIKIKTLDSQTYTLQVDKCVPVPALKEQIAIVTGILTEQQRLICRGKVLNDADLLSAYHVEDGHTLHLVVRQPAAPSSGNTHGPGTDSASATGQSQGSRGPGVLLGSFNFSEQDGAFPDFSRVISAVLGSLGIPGIGNSGEEIDLNVLPTERFSTTGPNQRNSGQGDSGPRSSPNLGVFPRQTAESSEPMQPPVIPDSITTLSLNLGHLRQEFITIADEQGYSRGSSSVHVMDGHNLNASSNLQRGLPTPADLANVMLSARQIINEQAAEGLLHLARQLEGQANVTDTSERSRIQSHAVRSGILFQNLGTMLLELGRTTMTVRMGDTPADAVVNAGPAVFLSSAGPNPIMVQPLPFQPGANLGAFSGGSVQQSAGLTGGSVSSGGYPRNIDIRIRTSSFMSSTGNERDSNGTQSTGNERDSNGTQNAAQEGAPAVSDNGNIAQQGASVGADGVPGNSAIRESEVRVIPLRTVIAAAPAAGARATTDASRHPMGFIYPVFSRVQTSGNSGTSATRASTEASNGHYATETANGNHLIPEYVVEHDSSSLFAEMTNGQGLPAEIQRGLEQLTRTMFSAENLPGGGSGGNSQDMETSFVFTQNIEITPTAETLSAAAETTTPTEEGIFLSNILHHIMPMVTENRESPLANTPSSDAHMVADGNRCSGCEQNGETGTSESCKRDDDQQNSKRQKRE